MTSDKQGGQDCQSIQDGGQLFGGEEKSSTPRAVCNLQAMLII